MINKQGPGKIDWCDVTWNPVSGCEHACSYCYMHKMVDRFNYDFTPRFHPDRLDDLKKLKKASKVFVSSSGDLFGEWVPNQWIVDVLEVVKEYPQHTFQFLTKNPKRYGDFQFSKNCWLGTTIDGTSKTIENAMAMLDVGRRKAIKKKIGNKIYDGFIPNKKFVSFEPLLTDVLQLYQNRKQEWLLDHFSWFIIGANSNPGADKPEQEWADALIAFAKSHSIPVWVKDNYHYFEKIKEWPKR
jgi:protein gp37